MKNLAVILVIISAVMTAQAVTLDRETHDALIGQLQEVRQNLKPQDVSYIPTTLRLADLLSDRARLLEMQSGDGQVNNENQIKADRTSAIGLISQIEKSLGPEQKSKVDLQKAQLFQMIGREQAAIQLLQNVRRDTSRVKTDEYWTATDLLADLAFSKGEFPKALAFYQELRKANRSVDFADYRIAWCELNLGREAQAVTRMESVLSRAKLDEGLRKEATHDLVIFYARRPFNKKTIEKIQAYSARSQSDAKENLRSYADELKRLGKKKESATVFVSYLSTTDATDSTLDAKADLFENLVDIGRTKQALNILDDIVQVPCKEMCADVQNKIHRTLHNWAAEQKLKPSADLMKAFAIYSKQRPLDNNALLLGIKTAQEGNKHREAMALLTVLIKETTDAKVLETALKAQIASAEKTKDAALREQAYRDYIARGTDQNIKNQATTELVRALAERKNYVEAEKVALAELNRKESNEVADILLATYQKSKQIEKQRDLSLRLAKGNANSVYFKEYKRATLVYVKERIDTNKADASDLKLLIEIAERTNNPLEQYRVLTDAYLVALDIQDFSNMKISADRLVVVAKKLGKKEQRLAYEKRIYVADLELDFATSLKFEKLMGSNSSNFRMALKSRLGGQPDLALEKRILTSSATVEQKMWILEQQIINGADPIKTLSKNKTIVAKSKELHSRLVLMALARSNPKDVQRYVEGTPSLRGSFVDITMKRRKALKAMQSEFQRLGSMKIPMNSMPAFDRKLNQFVEGLHGFEVRYVSGGADATLNLIAKTNWLVLNKKLINDLTAATTQLAVPKRIKDAFNRGLTAQLGMLKQKVAATEASLDSQWSAQQIEQSFEKVLAVAHPLQKRAVIEEIALWKSATQAPLNQKWALILKNIDQRSDSSSHSKLAQLYGELKKNPFKRDLVKQLAQAEEARGNHLVAAFLSERSRIGGI